MPISELRQDIVTGDWVIIAPGRKHRPSDFITKSKIRKFPSPKNDPFFDPQKSGNAFPVFVAPDEKNWAVQVFENKYPALRPNLSRQVTTSPYNPYEVMPATGYHEIIVTRDQKKNFPALSPKDALLVLQAARARYAFMDKNPSVEYVFMFQNWGATAGASIAHPHYQLVGIPIIPPDIKHALAGTANYYKKHKRYAYDTIIKWEQKHKRRIIAENKHAIAFTRFASKEPFDIRIFPKKHIPYFSDTDDKVLASVSSILQKALSMVEKKLGDPDYNFYIHSAPVKRAKKYESYHWHIDIIPKISISAGLEVGTGIEITVIDPDEAAKLLRQ